MKNKKGDVPVTLLVIGVFAVCSLALLTFFVSDFRISNSFVGLEIMDKANTLTEEYIFYSEKLDTEDFEELENYFNWTEENGVRYLELEKSYDKFSFSTFKKENTILFYVKMPLPS
jgi:hypothetical protein